MARAFAVVVVVLGVLGYAAAWTNTALLYGWVKVWRGQPQSEIWDPRSQWKATLTHGRNDKALGYVIEAREKLFPVPHMELLVAGAACQDNASLTHLVRVAHITNATVVLSPPGACSLSRITLPTK